ncbi:sigma-54-dependent Fis family transcriptional regulator, partial [Vineibacter terrae]|uniref:sigma-54-dependent Fis family transcriptional regulator n=1 Tax=Vineibacter terrae TaxID=2586908 RepID=UPI002E334105
SIPYVGFDKDPRSVKALWERYHCGLLDDEERRDPYHDLLVDEWRRCTAMGVDVTMARARRLSEEEFRQRAEANQLFLETSIPIIQDVGRFLDEVPGVMLLADTSGCMLHITGAPDVQERAAALSGIVQGSHWGEAMAGTNGMGTALTKRQPVHVFASEHFCEGLHRWSCAAAPIFDSDGSTVLGIIDFTTAESDFRDQALALTVSLANSIQARMGLHRALEHSRLMSAFGDYARRYPADDLLLVDRFGHIVTRSATDNSRRVAERWSSTPLDPAAVQASIEVTRPDSRSSIGRIVHLKDARATGHARVTGAEPQAKDETAAVRRFGQFMTCEPDTKAMLDALERVATADVNVLLVGETGTGKELLARHLHASSPRRAEPYLAVNCGAISAELMESTFFGYVRGAFSGADPRGRTGYFESARSGTLFLDEIGELPLAMQAALLRVLEDGSYLRVGSSEPRRAHCRVVAATHRNLAELVEQGRFRQDLYFRVKILQKTVKPLRERPCDIPLLARQFVKMLGVKHGLGACGLTAEAAAALERYLWPGNA